MDSQDEKKCLNQSLVVTGLEDQEGLREDSDTSVCSVHKGFGLHPDYPPPQCGLNGGWMDGTSEKCSLSCLKLMKQETGVMVVCSESLKFNQSPSKVFLTGFKSFLWALSKSDM